MKILAAACLVGALTSINAVANGAEEAICVGGPAESWASPEAVMGMLSKLIDKDFVLGLDKGCYEAEVVINETTMIDVYVDPVSLAIVRIRTNGEDDS
ncbi:MAG: PepSY domain-containing protein [Dongiaceae bacterium]